MHSWIENFIPPMLFQIDISFLQRLSLKTTDVGYMANETKLQHRNRSKQNNYHMSRPINEFQISKTYYDVNQTMSRPLL